MLPQTIQKHSVSVLGATKTPHRRCVSATGAFSGCLNSTKTLHLHGVSATGALWDCLGAAKTLHWRGVSHTGALTGVVFRPQGAQKHRVFAFAPRALTKCFKVALLGLLLVHFWPKASKTLENRPPGDTFGTCLAQGLKMLKIGLLGSLLVHVWPKASKCSKEASWDHF